jgi:hypothetical protein
MDKRSPSHRRAGLAYVALALLLSPPAAANPYSQARAWGMPAWLNVPSKPAQPIEDPCVFPIYGEERLRGIPAYLLRAVSFAESGRYDDAAKRQVAWPWTINAEGVGQTFPTKAAAIAAVNHLRGRGVKSIDVGCMQINLLWHANAFANLEAAFDPVANVAYAAKYLNELKDDRRSWVEAVGYYHSATPEYRERYKAKVMRIWNELQHNSVEAQMSLAAAQSAAFAAVKGVGGRAWLAQANANDAVGGQSVVSPSAPAQGFVSPFWAIKDPKTSAPRVNTMGGFGNGATTQARGLTLEHYRAAPTLPPVLSPSRVIESR